MQALAPVITLFFTNIVIFGLGVFYWTGTIFGYALLPGQQTTVDSSFVPALQKLHSS